jgi:predicted alpha/beta-fold hydrolase
MALTLIYQKKNTNIKDKQNFMEKYWQENIFNSIKAFSDFERQKSSWRGLSIDVVSSYIEDYNQLFFSFDFEEFIEKWKSEEFDCLILVELINFKDIINYYDNSISEEMQLNDIKILDDPNWLTVVKQAQKTVEVWKQNH